LPESDSETIPGHRKCPTAPATPRGGGGAVDVDLLDIIHIVFVPGVLRGGQDAADGHGLLSHQPALLAGLAGGARVPGAWVH
jgi:hypothetical protein